MVSLEEVSPAAVAAFQAVRESSRVARAAGDVEALKAQREHLDDLTLLSKPRRDYLRKGLDEAISLAAKETPDEETSRPLAEMEGERGRGWLKDVTGGRVSTPPAIQKIAPNGISYIPRPGPDYAAPWVGEASGPETFTVSILNRTPYRVAFKANGTGNFIYLQAGKTGTFTVEDLGSPFISVDQLGAGSGSLKASVAAGGSYLFAVDKKSGLIRLYTR